MMTLLLVVMLVTFLAMGLKLAEHYLMREALEESKNFDAAVEARKGNTVVTHDPEFGIFKGWVCPTWEHNRIERELGGTDIISCDHIECGACYPNGKCAVADCSLPGLGEWHSGYLGTNHEYLCNSHLTVRQDERDKRKAVMAKIKAEEAATANAAKRKTIDKEASNRETYVGDYVVIRPDSVPEYAYRRWAFSDVTDRANHVVWTWTDPGSGKSTGVRSFHPELWDLKAHWINPGAEPTYEIHDGAGNILKSDKSDSERTIEELLAEFDNLAAGPPTMESARRMNKIANMLQKINDQMKKVEELGNPTIYPGRPRNDSGIKLRTPL